MSLTPGTLLGRYEVESLLGAGGMGEVYLATDRHLARKVAVKLLPAELARSEDFKRRFRQEARAASALNHPGILTVYDVDLADGVPFIAMEYIEGITLRERLEEGRITVAEALAIGAQVASALTAAESAGVVHRDVKPENVMLRSDGFAKVLDFGLAKLMAPPRRGSDGDTLVETMPDVFVGTTRYMSPEQVRGLPVDSRTDVWSLGAVIYEMIAHRPPFKGPTVSDTIVAILTEPPPPLAALTVEPLPPGLERVVARALTKDRGARTPSCRALHTELVRLRDASAASGVGRDSTPWLEITTALGAPPKPFSSLPVPLTRFVGRETELRELTALLREDDARIVTLTGPGGSGKTRLALQAATILVEELTDGSCFVPLASVTEPALVASAVAQAVGAAEAPGVTALQALKEQLAPRELLLVLDNFEQVLPATPLVADLLAAAPRLKILVTSRASLHVQGERELPVPPLRVPPDTESLPELDALGQVSAIALFVNRARAVRPDFALTVENARAVSDICRRLDGLPLAIELAAARVKLLPPQALLARLANRLGMLTGGGADLPPRQQTMRGALAWGIQLLSPAEQCLFRWLSVFVGGFALEAAEDVCRGLDGVEVLDALGSLVDKSLVRQEAPPDGEPRFAMLETVREYASELLAESGEAEDLRQRHAAFFRRLGETARAELVGERQPHWLGRLEREHDNLRAALEWELTRGDANAALDIAGSVWRFWYLRGHYTEGRKWLEKALAKSAGDTPTRARALVGAGALAFLQCDYMRAEGLLTGCLALARQVGDRRSLANALQFLGSVARERGRHAEAISRHRESLALWRELGETRGVAHSLNYIGFAAWLSGDFGETEEVCRESRQLFRSLQDAEGTAWAVLNLAAIALYRGRTDDATTLGKESLLLASDAGYKEGMAWSLDILGNVAIETGHRERSLKMLARSLELHRELGDRWRMASVVDSLARLLATDEPEKAARLLGAGDALRETVGTPIPPVEQLGRDRAVASLASALGPERLPALLREGRADAGSTVHSYITPE